MTEYTTDNDDWNEPVTVEGYYEVQTPQGIEGVVSFSKPLPAALADLIKRTEALEAELEAQKQHIDILMQFLGHSLDK